VLETVANRDYYTFEDPVHLALGKKLWEIVEKVTMVDFTSDLE
jgi:hypothetical protein